LVANVGLEFGNGVGVREQAEVGLGVKIYDILLG
jgi:hypothetical protein